MEKKQIIKKIKYQQVGGSCRNDGICAVHGV